MFKRAVERKFEGSFLRQPYVRTLALDWAKNTATEAELDRHVLDRIMSGLETTDSAHVVALLAKQLTRKDYPKVFGHEEWHTRGLTLMQLDELRKLVPAVINESTYVNTYLQRIVAPRADVERDAVAFEKALAPILEFIDKLSNAFNAMKATVYYNALYAQVRQGKYDEATLVRYLSVPKYCNYSNAQFLEAQNARQQTIPHASSLGSIPTLKTPSSYEEEELVKHVIIQLFIKRESWQKSFETLVNVDWLKDLFATAKLLYAPVSEMEKARSLFRYSSTFDSLKREVRLQISPYSSKYWSGSSKVSLSVEVKNVPKLIVKLFEINTLRYYRDNLSEIPADISLDGLVPSEELQFAYDEADHTSVKREFSFPNLDGRNGVFVIEFVGAGLSQRAIIYKGRLNVVERQTIAGHAVTIMNEKFEKLPEAKLWMSGHLYTSDQDGEITIPYSTSGNQTRTAVVYLGSEAEDSLTTPFADLFQFEHASESYSFDAAVHVERESLVPFNKTSVIVKPKLLLNNSIATPASLLTDVFLTLSTEDIDSVSSSKDIPIKFVDGVDFTYDFQVPDRLMNISFHLRASIKTMSTSAKQNFTYSTSYDLNGIDRSSTIEQTFLRHTKEAGYSILLLGKTGDAIPRREVSVNLVHGIYNDFSIWETLTTDDKGVIPIGHLPDFNTINANSISFDISPPATIRASTLHLKSGQELQVAVSENDIPGGELKPEFVSLVSWVEEYGVPLADFKHMLKYERGLLTAPRGLLAGTYILHLKRSNQKITIHVEQALQSHSGFLFGSNQILEKSPFSQPLQVAAVTEDSAAGTLKIEIANHTETTRVHVFPAEFVPEYDVRSLFNGLARPGMTRNNVTAGKKARYTSRELSEEQRYVLDRRYATARQGNTLTPPSLLLNPWAVDTTKTARKDAGGGGAYGGGSADMARLARNVASAASSMPYSATDNMRNFDFKFYPCKTLYNLKPDASGAIVIKRAQLGGTPNAPLSLRIVAVDETEMILHKHAMSATTLPEPAIAVKDLRLKPARALNPTEHFAEQKHISLLQANEKFSVEDLSTSKIEILDSLQKVYSFFTTVSSDAHIKDWNWLLKWDSLSVAEREEKYHEYASHELHVFLYFKDRAYFDSKIAPFLKNKMQKTFIDEWLLISDPAHFTKYAQPGLFATLNAAEKALLVHRLPAADANALSKSMQDLSTAIAFSKNDRNKFNHLFKTVLGSSSLNTEGDGYVPEEDNDDVALEEEVLEAAPVLAKAMARSSAVGGGGGGGRLMAMAPPPPMASAAPMMMMMAAPCPAPSASFAESEIASPRKRKKSAAPSERKREKREVVAQLFQAPEKTKKYAESQYYKQADPQRSNTLISMNAFWSDYAAHRAAAAEATKGGSSAFLSKNFIYATGSFAEMVFALAVLDLPLSRPAQNHPTEVHESGGMTLTALAPVVVFHKDIKQCPVEKRQVLIVQNFFDPDDRHTTVNGEYCEKYIEEEFLNRKVYGCNYIVTNIGSSPQRIEVLLQVPVGAIPVLSGSYTKSVYMDVSSYTTQSGTYYFYFPRTGDYPVFPVHAARDEKAVAWAQVQLAAASNGALHVVDKLSKHDRKSWTSYVSQLAPNDEVFEYLEKEDIFTIDLTRIAWRMRDAVFFKKATEILRTRATFNKRLWAYAVTHKDGKAMGELLMSDRQALSRFVGVNAEFEAKTTFADCTTNAWAIRQTQHYEFWPLINARAHQLGARRTILNDGFKAAYEQFLNHLAYRAVPTKSDLLIGCYYMLLQDRVDEAIKLFEKARAAKLEAGTCAETLALQVDYLAAYLDFFNEKPTVARDICTKHISHPVLRWRRMFQEILKQLTEFDTGARPEDIIDPDDRNARMGKAAHSEPSLDVETVPGKIVISHHALKTATLSFYKMDIELLFSSADYKPNELGKFAYVRPNLVLTVQLNAEAAETYVDVPSSLDNCNVMVEVSAGPHSKVVSYFSHSLLAKLSQSYGQVQVHDRKTGRALSRVYVKVFSLNKDGSNLFYKDGYTDLRGAFDYASLSTDEIGNVSKFYILIMSPSNGTRILEAAPPAH